MGNNKYEIRLTVYRDCYNGVPPFDEPAAIGIFDANNTLINYPFQFTGFYPQYSFNPTYFNNVTFNNNQEGLLLHVRDSASVPNVINSPCLIPPTNVCYKVGHYIDTISLPPIAGGYQLVYQRCCRNKTILNIINPEATGATYYAAIPDTDIVKVNSNPIFKQLPPTFICVSTPFTFDHSAIDYDGDSLVYNICMPWDGATTTNPIPQPPNDPPYVDVQWQSGYSLNNVLGGIPMKINPKTGLLTATPNTLGQFVYAVCVEEYRKGVLVGETRRDFQVNVVSCPNIVVASIQSPSLVCGTKKANFVNSSVGAASYHWDFGVKNLTNDTSNAYNPSYTYPDTGYYNVMLVAYSGINPGCNDTSYSTVHIASGLKANFKITGGGCSKDVAFIDSSTSGSGNVNYWSWSFGDAGSSSVQNPTHNYINAETYSVTMISATADGCRDTVTKPVVINPLPKANFTNTPDCSHGAGFTDVSTISSGTVTNWLWNFGDSTTAIQQNPTHNYSTDGTYSVSFVVTSNLGCKDSITKNILLNPSPKADFTNISNCLNDTTFFTNTSSISGGTITNWSWNFGDNDISTLQHPTHLFNAATSYNATLIITSALGCKDSITKKIIINPLPVANFTNTSACLKNNITFTDASTISSGTITNWSWNFGDTVTSSVQNPVHAYDSLKTQNVTLIVASALGCKDTVSKPIDVNPLPIANFINTIVCFQDTTKFTESSTVSNATITSWTWIFGDSTATSTLQNPQHTYISDVSHDVKLIVTSSKGCKDSLTKSVQVYSLPTANAGNDKAICIGDSTQLNASGGTTYNWQPTSNLSNPNIANPWTTTAITITYTVKVTDGNNCAKKDSVVIKVNPLPVANAGPDLWLCPGDSIPITTTGNSSYIYSWTPTASLSNANTATPLAFPAVTTDYFLAITDTNNCVNKDTVKVKVNAIVPTDAGNDTSSICLGKTTIIGGSPTAPPWTIYSWSPSTGLNAVNVSNPSAKPTSTTTYYVKTFNDTCHGLDSVIVKIDPLPKANFTAKPVCLNEQTVFIDSSQIISGSVNGWLWNFGNNDSSFVQNPIYLFATSGAHSVSLIVYSMKGCSDTISRSVQIFPLPTTKINKQTDASCNGFCDGTATASTSGGTVPYFYAWSNGQIDSIAKQLCAKQYNIVVTDVNNCKTKDSITITEPTALSMTLSKTDIICYKICDGTAIATVSGGTTPYIYSWSNSQNTPSIKNLCPDVYRLMLTDAHKCQLNDSIIVIDNFVKPVITATSEKDTLIKGQSTNLSVNIIPDNNYTFNWVPTNSLNNATSSNPVATLFSTTTYFVTATDKNNCIAMDTIKIYVVNASCNEKDIFVPNGFTPDDDGHNDVLLIKAKAIQELYFAIFNRWGEKVFETTNVNVGWDGTYKGVKAAPDVFVYYVKAKCWDGEEYFKKGNITLIR